MLIGIGLIAELVQSIMLTGRVQNADEGKPKPLSLLLIAPPESGKTSVVLANKSKLALDYTDITGMAILEEIQKHPEMTHLIINDLGIVGGHRASVQKYTMGVICALVEEGLTRTAFPGGAGHSFTEPRKGGVIASVPSKLANDGRAWWVRTGLASRMLPFNYSHSKALRLKIRTHIEKGDSKKKPTKKTKVLEPEVAYPEKNIRVHVGPAMAHEIRKIADARGESLGEYGYRRGKQYRILCQGHALYRGDWKNAHVTERDVEFLALVDPYVSYTKAKEI